MTQITQISQMEERENRKHARSCFCVHLNLSNLSTLRSPLCVESGLLPEPPVELLPTENGFRQPPISAFLPLPFRYTVIEPETTTEPKLRRTSTTDRRFSC